MRQKINKTANRREITSIKKAVSYLTRRDYTIILSTKPFVSVTGNKKIDDIPQTGGNDNQWIKEFPSATQISKYIQYSSRFDKTGTIPEIIQSCIFIIDTIAFKQKLPCSGLYGSKSEQGFFISFYKKNDHPAAKIAYTIKKNNVHSIYILIRYLKIFR